MAAPTTRFRLIPQGTLTTAINTPAQRLATITGESIISTGLGNEASLGSVDILDAADNSNIITMLWDVTANNGCSVVQDFAIWLSSNGFDQAGSVAKLQALSGADQGAPANTENYIADAVIGNYTWITMPEEQPTINVWPSDEGIAMSTPSASDDVVMWAMYFAIAQSETSGIYRGLTTNFQLQLSFRYSYS